MMKLVAFIITFLSALTLTNAAPSIAARGGPSDPDSYKQYYLKSKIINNSGPKDLDGLYVYPYHTGAGLADACLDKKPHYTSFINGTFLEFNLSSQFGGHKFYPAGMELVLDQFYTSFGPVQINVGYGSHGYYKKNGKLQSHFQKEFGGWRVCRWWHYNVPQLFHKYNFANKADISSNCADVELVLVPAKEVHGG